MLRTPRAKFCESTHREAFLKLVQTGAFEEASVAALLELQSEQPENPSPNQAADAYNRILGAKRYLEILCSIHQSETQPKKAPEKGLDYSSGV